MKEKHATADKHKKSKKKHKKKKYKSSSSSDSDSDDNMQWVEASPPSSSKKHKKKKKKRKRYESSSGSSEESGSNEMPQKERSHPSPKESPADKYSKPESSSHSVIAEKRDSWMSEESFVPTLSKEEIYTSSRQKRMKAAQEKRQEEENIQRERELNPYLKNDGSGLPEKEANVQSLSLPSTSVGDGGYSFLKKAYYRIQEQAQDEGRSMEEVAVERWGSLSKLTSLIEEAEERMKSHPDFRQRRDGRYDKSFRHGRSQFQKPRDDNDSQRTYDSDFKFRKPSEDSRSRKPLNQFVSSRKYEHEHSKKSDDERPKEKSKTPDRQYFKMKTIDDSGNKNHIPAWKKINYSEEDAKASSKSNDNAHSETRLPAWKKHNVEKTKEKHETVSFQSSSEKPIPAWKKKTHNDDNVEEKMPGSSLEESQSNISTPIYSDEDLNKLAAKQLKAELRGDTELAMKLKNQLEEARKIVEEKGYASAPSKKVEEVILTKIDSQGQIRPIKASQEKIEDYKYKKSNKYLEDSSRYSLKQMFEREKLTTADDHLEMFVEATTQSNELAEIDYESGHISKKLSQKLSSSREEDRDIGKAIQQHKKLASSLEKCQYCLDQKHMKKHLIVEIGEEVYLCLPNFQTLNEGHCLIVPKAHVPSCLSLDENDLKEINDFKNQLRCMFRSEDKSVIFLETSMNFRHFPHAVIECIPIPRNEADMAPFYFKKAIQESESEWAHNKKLIDLTKKGLRYSVPKNLPYFHVEFDPEIHAGFAHVIEDEKYFPRNFGKEVLGGMLDIDYNFLYKNRKEDPLKQSKDTLMFEKLWNKFKNVK